MNASEPEKCVQCESFIKPEIVLFITAGDLLHLLTHFCLQVNP